MSVCLFIGPSLSRSEVESVEGWHILPPVEQGDVYRCLSLRPRAIGIVDGRFDGVPSVWHKEILFALHKGVHVFGASSMGALRAVELQRYGMHGVGKIFQKFSDGTWQDDDEVAVLHGPAELDYTTVSVPMTDIRATLEQALDHNLLDASQHETLTTALKATFYADRSWTELARVAKTVLESRISYERFEKWLQASKVEQKQRDAKELVRVLTDFMASDPQPFAPEFHFETNEMWLDAVAEFDFFVDQRPDRNRQVSDQELLQEAGLDPDYYDGLRRATVLRLLAGRQRSAADLASNGQRHISGFRADMGLTSAAKFHDWLKDNGLTEGDLSNLLGDVLATDEMIDALVTANRGTLIDTLRISGEYAMFVQQVERKQKQLGNSDTSIVQPESAGLFREELLGWYFETRVGMDPPEDLQLWSRRYGFGGVDEFLAALSLEYQFEKHMSGSA